MKIHSSRDTSFVSLEVVGTERVCLRSVNLHVSISDEGFAGCVWVESDDFKQFVTDLRQCEHTRAGRAALSSMSPGEFEMVVERCDSAGHFVVRYQLAPYAYTCQGPIQRTLAGAFDLDSECFGQMAQSASQLLDTSLA